MADNYLRGQKKETYKFIKAAMKVTVTSLILVPVDSVVALKLIGVAVLLPLASGVPTVKCLLSRYTMDEFNDRITISPGDTRMGCNTVIKA